MSRKHVFIILFTAMSASACTGEQTYAAGQAWQRNQCARILDKAEYERCMNDAARSYDSYKREKSAGQN